MLWVILVQGLKMSLTDHIYRVLKYGMSKGRNFKNSEAVSSPVIVDRTSMANFIAELRACGYDLANCAKRLGVIPRYGVNFSWMRTCDTWASVEADPVDTLLEVLSGVTRCLYLESQLISHPNP